MKKLNPYTYRYIIFIVTLILIFPQVLPAQTIQVSGTAWAEDTQEVLIGATVRNGTQAITTDLDGRFSLDGMQLNDTLTVSYIGYESTSFVLTPEADLGDLRVFLNPSQNILQTATVTSGKYEKPLGEITVSMEILKPKLIEEVSTASMKDVLEKVPGVTIIDGQPNIRGGSGFSYGAGSRVLLLIDDIPALTSDAGFPNWDDIPIELTNQIEILKGASSALYGSSALNGIINLRTDFAKDKPETSVASFATIYQTPQDASKKWWMDDRDTIPFDFATYITHKQKFGKLDVVASVFLRHHQTWNKNSYTIYQRGSLGLRYKLSKKWTAAINGNFRTGKNSSFFYWQNSDSLALTGNPNAFVFSEPTRYIIDPSVQYADDRGNRHKFLGRLYKVNNRLENNQSNFSTLYYGEYQYQKRFLQADFVLTGGLVGSYTTADAELYSNSTFTSNNLAAYVQGDKKIFDKLNLSLGLRYERNQINAPDSIPINNVNMAAGTDEESKPVFRLGANYQLGKFSYLRASFGQGFRFPTIAEKYISTQVGFTISPNLDLQSETGWSTEIGLKQGIKINGFKGLVDIALFQTQYEDMMEFTFSNNFAIGFQSQNVGNTIIRGIDFNVAGGGEILSGFPINVLMGYTYIDPKFTEFGDEERNSSTSENNILKYRFQHTAKLDVATDFNRFNFGIAGFYYSNMESIDRLLEFFIPGLQEYRAENNNGVTIWNLRASFKPKKQLKISILWRNVLNKEYSLRPGILNAPRNLTIRGDYKF